MKTLFSTPDLCISRPAMVDPTSLYLLTYDGLCFVRDGETKIIYPFSDQISPFRTVFDTTDYLLSVTFQPPVWKNGRILFGAIEKQTDGSIAHKLKIVTPEGELLAEHLVQEGGGRIHAGDEVIFYLGPWTVQAFTWDGQLLYTIPAQAGAFVFSCLLHHSLLYVGLTEGSEGLNLHQVDRNGKEKVLYSLDNLCGQPLSMLGVKEISFYDPYVCLWLRSQKENFFLIFHVQEEQVQFCCKIGTGEDNFPFVKTASIYQDHVMWTMTSDRPFYETGIVKKVNIRDPSCIEEYRLPEPVSFACGLPPIRKEDGTVCTIWCGRGGRRFILYNRPDGSVKTKRTRVVNSWFYQFGKLYLVCTYSQTGSKILVTT